MFKNTSSFIKIFGAGLAIGLVVAAGFYAYSLTWNSQTDSSTVSAEFDKIAIIQAVQKQSRLETVTTTVQRNLVVTLDLGDFSVFNFSILQNNRQQEISATAKVGAGIDLSLMKNDDFIFDEASKTVVLTLPAPKVFYVEIIPEQTDLLKDDATFLFQFQTFLNNQQKDALNEYLFQQVILQSKTATKQAACADDILGKANKNAIDSLTNLLKSSGVENVKIVTTPKTNADCQAE